ncbi:tagaturonate reductase [Dyadobacter chenwenxiniae]|uniref:Tagaturonate reductase n=1 Tax=Dyadobacter chenwenxiniae TaxID=2906456 RepID=A0A9X1TL68_9BACT|nr:tagaturonate reductase [Dyadobacter chenwenxiniae]MCF0061903.1 tagaturonate reductase [Dyadobacter chenwenxiniae]UON81718.1 tagaturonate reductase [Dyadobacter chenwenxiniae]
MSLPQLCPQLLDQRPDLLPNHQNLLALPEKIIQFGTGVLLRGLPDYFVNKANQQGIFNGRIVVVKSTNSGGTDAFAAQQNIFSHSIRGIEDGSQVDKLIINSAISRTLSANTNWADILQCAHNADLRIVISNTTEVGIQLTDDDIFASPPASYPGKLTAYLYERFKAFDGSADSGMVIVPTELIVNSGQKLRDIVFEQAKRHNLDETFVQWLEAHNHFCSSLVDRIVPGKPDAETIASISEKQGYQDDLLIVSEVYRLWAIEGSEHVRSILNFAEADKGVVIEPDIDLYRELKLRLLNGTHTLACGLCFLSGLDTVSESMENPETAAFIADVMLNELAPAIPYPVDPARAQEFGNQVLDRFRNPFIRHQLIDITVQYTAKMRMRNIPTLLSHYEKSEQPPALFAKGFAAFLKFMKPVVHKDGAYYGEREGQPYSIRCDAAPYFDEMWKSAASPLDLASKVMSDVSIWDTDLTQLPGFPEAVHAHMVEPEALETLRIVPGADAPKLDI